MNLAELAVIYSITNATFIKCISLLRENTGFSQYVMILLCRYTVKLYDTQKFIMENFNKLGTVEYERSIKEYISEKVTECAELEKRISEETQISLYTH
tara:strand:- start:995 stop:1288 length:294 start_codon:yes stop_codon:yes gene_type:complete